ncbi:hypothetical protein A4X09_0g7487, partial [Tilletia walkeri]
MVDKDVEKVLRPSIVVDSTEVGGAALASAGKEGRKDEEQDLAIEKGYAECRQPVMTSWLMQEAGEGESSDEDEVDYDPDVEDIIEIYRAEENGQEVIDSPVQRLHNCLLKIRAKQFDRFQDVVDRIYTIKKARIPTLRGATRWNSFLRELRGCIKIQKAFTAWVDEEDTDAWNDTWKPFAVRPSEWNAMAKFCTVLGYAETVTMDVQTAKVEHGVSPGVAFPELRDY